MAIIYFRGSGANPCPDSTTDNPSNPPGRLSKQPIEDLLIKVGKRVLGDELHTEYMGIGKVARVAQKYKIPWTGGSQRATKLEELATQYFENQDRILGDGIKVTWRIQNDGWESELQLRFHKYDPANDGPMPD